MAWFKKKNTAEEEISLLPEEGFIPEELPPLETKETPEQPEINPTLPNPIQRPVNQIRRVEVIESVEKFMKMEQFKGILSEINNINLDFDNVDTGISRVVELKDEKNEKIDGLQSTLEEVSKKLMFMENTLFGG